MTQEIQEITWVHRTLIVAAATAPLARQLAATLTGPGGEGMWQTPLSPTGLGPATHYISAGAVDQVFADLLPLTTVGTDEDGEAVVATTPGQPRALAALAHQAGMSVDEAQVTAVLDAADVSDQDPHATLVRLGLQIVQQEAPR